MPRSFQTEISMETSIVEQNTNSNLHTIPGKMIDLGRSGKAVAVERKHEWAVILAGGDGTRLTPALSHTFICLAPLLGTDPETKTMGKVYGRLTETNFSDKVLALVPERLAVLKVTGIQWSDLGEPNRVLASIQLAGLRPPWMENY
jgi:hypothetical protein